MEEQPSRARGRARGQQPPADSARRPGGPPPAPPPQQPQPTAGYAGPNIAAAGRRAHRGVGRNDPPNQPPPGSIPVEQLAQSMASCGIDASGRGRSRAPPTDDNTRPPNMTDKKGMTGEKINLVANFFEVLSRPQWVVYQYHIEFAPLVESPSLRRAFMREHKEVLGDCFLFDGMSDLKTIKKIHEGVELYSYDKFTYNENIRITMKFVAELAPNHPELARLFNMQMKSYMNVEMLDVKFTTPSEVTRDFKKYCCQGKFIRALFIKSCRVFLHQLSPSEIPTGFIRRSALQTRNSLCSKNMELSDETLNDISHQINTDSTVPAQSEVTNLQMLCRKVVAKKLSFM